MRRCGKGRVAEADMPVVLLVSFASHTQKGGVRTCP